VAPLARDGAARVDDYGIGEFSLRTGLGPRTELRLGWTGLGISDAPGGRSEGVGDVSIGLRHNLRNPDGSGFSMSVQGYVTLPTGTGPLDTGQWSAGLGLPLAIELSPRVAFAQYLPDLTIILASPWLGAADTAVLLIVLRCANLVRFGVVSVEMSITPRLARADADGDAPARARILRTSAHLRFWPVMAGCAALALLAPGILSVFGPQYVAGVDAFRVSLLAPVVLALFGPSHVILTVRGRLWWVAASAGLGLGTLAVGVPIGHALGGLTGIAAATAAATLASSFTAWYVLKRLTGLDTSVVFALRRA